MEVKFAWPSRLCGFFFKFAKFDENSDLCSLKFVKTYPGIRFRGRFCCLGMRFLAKFCPA